MEEIMGIPPLRILVVDDDRVCRLTTTKQLEQTGYKVGSATNAFEAMKYLEENTWDIVVTDLRMPQMNGIEFVHRLRADHPETDQIVITAHGTVDTAVEAMRMGVADFLTKPFPFDVLRIQGPEPRAPDDPENSNAPSDYEPPFLINAAVGLTALLVLLVVGLGGLYWLLVQRPRRA